MKRFSYAMMLLAVAGWGCGSNGGGGNAGTMGLGTAGVSANQPGAGMLGNAGMGFAGQQANGGTNAQLGGTGGTTGGVGAAGVGAAGTGIAGVGAAGTGVAGVGAGTGAAGTGAAGTGAAGTDVPPQMPVDNPVQGLDIPPECQGIDFNNILYSPGGNALPNVCEPFHPTVNNPYAVRCVDAWPWYETQFPGDNYCILPPPPELGIQYGFHPQGSTTAWFAQVSTGDLSGYSNPSDPWVMSSGQEEEVNYHNTEPSPTERHFYRTYVRMRAGSHHMINSVGSSSGAPNTWTAGSPDGLFAGTSLPGGQRPDDNTPMSFSKPPEDDGLYRVLPANPNITYNVHHFNSTPGTILKEAWVNLWFEDDARIPVRGLMGLDLLQVATMSIAPGAEANYHYAFPITSPIRIVTLYGHRHAWTPNFSAWVEHPGGETEILYQSFDWFDMPTFRYDSQNQNPAPNPDLLTDGAASGVQMLNAGDKLHFNCNITYTQQRAADEGAPSPNTIGTLRFANEAFTGEMCILFGTTAGEALTAAPGDLTPLPSFATVH